MDVTFVSAKALRSLFEVLSDFVQAVAIDADSDGLRIQAMDSSHVCLVSVNMYAKDAGFFDAFECGEAKTLGVNVTNFLRALKCAAPDDRVRIRADIETGVMAMAFDGDGARSADIELKLMDIDEERLAVPEWEGAVRFDVESAAFARVIRDLSSLGDTARLSIAVHDDGTSFLTLACEGDVGRASVRLKGKCDDSDGPQESKPAGFSLKHLTSISKGHALSDELSIEALPDMPVRVEFLLTPPNSATTRSYARFYLAPKLEDEDNE